MLAHGHHPTPSKPALGLPLGACDAHVHVFGPPERFPFAPNAPFTPPTATKEQLYALHAHLGITRCVIVQSTAHGFDNRVTAAAIAGRPGTYVGIALVPLEVSDAELDRLDAAGFRGVRFHFVARLGGHVPIEAVMQFAQRLVRLNWHLQLHWQDEGMLAQLAPHIARAPVPVVIDHMGRVDASKGVNGADFRALLRLVQMPHVWVKVSAPERISRERPPYAEAAPFAQALIQTCPTRTLWGSDWPHPNMTGGSPDDGALVDFIATMAPSEEARQRLLLDNPQRLYRFPCDAPNTSKGIA